jgi:hypothetical protein
VFVRNLSARERRTIALGLLVTGLGLFTTYGALPFVRHWRMREDIISTELDRLARLRGLVRHEAQLRQAVRTRAASLESGQQRLLAGRTPALAASALQALLQSYADQSQVTVSRLDVAGAPDTTSGPLPMIPATLSGVGDVYGITDLLSLVQHGALLLEIAELNVRPNPALRGDLLQVTVLLRGAYLGS